MPFDTLSITHASPYDLLDVLALIPLIPETNEHLLRKLRMECQETNEEKGRETDTAIHQILPLLSHPRFAELEVLHLGMELLTEKMERNSAMLVGDAIKGLSEVGWSDEEGGWSRWRVVGDNKASLNIEMAISVEHFTC